MQAASSVETWRQTYLLFGHGIGISFLLASLPVATMLVLLGVLRRPAWFAALCGLAVTFLLALAGYGMPVRAAAGAASLGVAFGLFPISWIVLWALVLFRITAESGQFEIIKNSVARVTPDPRLQALLIAFAFGGFLEGAAGFGTPVAIAATMLVGLGFTPFRASAICLLANTAPVAFGSIGIPIITLALTTGLSPGRLSAAVGALCAPVSLILPLYLMLALGGLQSMSGVWLPVLLTGIVYSAVQVSVATWVGPQLTDILSALSAMLALILLLRRRRKPDLLPGPVALTFAHGDATGQLPSVSDVAQRLPAPPPLKSSLFAWTSYGLLVLCVLLWGWRPWQQLMNRLTVSIPWPGLHDVVYRVPPAVVSAAPYHAIFLLNWLSAAGTACMVAALLSAITFRVRPARLLRLLLEVAVQLRLPTLTVCSVLAIAFLLNYCGATATMGLAFATTGRGFPFFSALLGWLGVFLTGSDTSANALFGNLQVVTADRLGFSPVLMAAANSAGGVMGKMISLQTIAIAAAATGLTALEQVRLFRFTLRHSIMLAGLIGCLALLYAYVVPVG